MSHRREGRLLVEVPGSFEATGASRQNLYVSEISPNGCRLNHIQPSLNIGDIIQVYVGPIGPLDATVRWTKDGQAGVEFQEALDSEVVDYFATYCSTAA